MIRILIAATTNLPAGSAGKTAPRWRKQATAVVLLTLGMFALPASLRSQEPATVATVDGQAISSQELSNAATAQLLPLHSQEYQIQTKTLEKLIRQKLLESAARKRGETTEALLAEQVDGAVAKPSDAEVLSYYLALPERNRQPFAEVEDQLRDTLRKAKIEFARDAYLDRLRSEANVIVLLDAPRIKVAYDVSRLKGNSAAPVVIVEFADFQCPFCRQQEHVLKNIMAKYANQVALAYRDFPVSQLHPLAEQAAEASRCAGEQGDYWQMYELLMGGQLDPVNLKRYAHELKLDDQEFYSCLTDGKYRDAVESDRQYAERLGITATPTFFINGIAIVGGQDEASLSNVIERELAQQAASQSSK
jgi:predicted DsbA family dithiol-disulfide isomerase